MSLKTGDVDRAFKKLGMETREGKDGLAFFRYKEKLILTTRRSHGKGKIEGNPPTSFAPSSSCATKSSAIVFSARWTTMVTLTCSRSAG